MKLELMLVAFGLLGCSAAVKPLPQVAPTPESTLLQWVEPPPVAPESDLSLDLGVRRVTFDNQLSLTVVTRADSSMTSLQLWVPHAGDRSEGRVAVMADALRAGTRVDEKTILVNPKLAYEPVVIGTRPTGTTFSWQVLQRASRQALRVLSHFVFHPVFEPQETRDRLEASLTSIQRYSGGAGHLADIARSALPGLKVPTPEQDLRRLIELTPKQLAKVHRCVMTPARAELVVTGPLPFDQVEPWARATFGSIAAPPSDPSCGDLSIAALDPESVKGEQIEVAIVYGGGVFDPIVMMSMPGPPPSSPDYVAFSLLAEVLEARDVGSAQELRHMGATYGVHFSVNDSFPGLSVLEVQGQIEEDNLQRAVRQVIEDIRSVAESLTPEQLDEVKRRWRNEYVGTLSSNAALASAALWNIRRGKGPEALTSWPNELMAISIEQCRDTARRWLSNAQPSIAVTGMPGKLGQGLNLNARFRALRWTYDLQEQRKL